MAGIPRPESSSRTRADEIREAIASSDGDRARLRLLDFARDFGRGPHLDDAIILSHRFVEISKHMAIVGRSSDDLARRNDVLLGVLRTVDEIELNLEHSEPVAGGREPARGAAKDAFVAGDTRDRRAAAYDVALTASDLQLTRRKREPPFALRGVSLDLKVGEILALVGANGQGKSTLLEIIAGRIAREGGDLRYPYVKEQEWSLIKVGISYLPQSFRAGKDVSETALRYIAALRGSLGADNDLVVEYTLERLGLARFRRVPASELSRGYQVRFALALALLRRPRLLLLDEPLAHLDIPTQSRFLGDLRDLARATTNPFAAIISSQHLHEIESISDKTLVLRDGRPEYYGPTADLGARRAEEIYEMLADRSAEDIGRILAPLGECNVERAGANVIVRLPRGVHSTAVLQCLLAGGARVSYFRNIGGSARPYLQEGP